MVARNDPDDGAHEQLAMEYSRLTPSHRVALALHYWEGLSYAEIGEVLGVPIGTVMSWLHRARAQLKQRMRLHPEGQEQDMATPDEVVQDVQAEIDILNEMFRDTKQPVERLSVILERSPGRVTELLEHADGVQLVPRLGRLLTALGSASHVERLCDETREEELLLRLGRMLRWVDRQGFDVVVARAFSADSDERDRARVVLRGWVGTDPSAGSGVGGRAYWLLDHLHGRAVSREDGVECLLDMLTSVRDATTRHPFVEYVLCDVDIAFPALISRYRAGGRRVFFDALARSGARFCRWLLDELNAAAGDADRASQLLDSVAAVAFSREPRDSKWAARPAPDLALRQRGTASGAPHSPTGLDCDTRRDVTQVARDTLHAADAGARATAVRILRAMAPDGVVETLLACMDDPALAPRLDAIMALGELGGAGTVSVRPRARSRPSRRSAK